MKAKLTAIVALVGSGLAAAAPFIDFGGAINAVTASHPAIAPVVSILLALLAQHQPGLFKPAAPQS